MSSGVMVLTGGPGTGKTTVVKALLRIFNSMGLKVALAAPTGRAAKRLSESTQNEAKTIHRMLEFSFEKEDEAVFLRNKNNLLEEGVVIIDEMSMTDTYLFCALLKAVKPGAHLILIGDADQLPSVGAGNVLHDILESGRFSTVKLTEVFRQAQESLIITNAHRINEGQMPVLNVGDNDFFFLPRESDSAIASTIAELCHKRLPKAYGTDIVSQIQVITPSRRGEGGTENLNRLLQSVLNPVGEGKAEHAMRERVFRVGDKVMQIKNNYEIEWVRGTQKGMGIFNGDIGEILSIRPSDKLMEIRFDDRMVSYEFSMLEELELAYAITVHKSQGSEYPVVIIPVYSAAPMLLTRNLFYTAVTRAQKMVILVGKTEVVATMVENDRHTLRYTGLGMRLGS
jgi:exodeoxyribonuclease V alpha subunit